MLYGDLGHHPSRDLLHDALRLAQMRAVSCYELSQEWKILRAQMGIAGGGAHTPRYGIAHVRGSAYYGIAHVRGSAYIVFSILLNIVWIRNGMLTWIVLSRRRRAGNLFLLRNWKHSFKVLVLSKVLLCSSLASGMIRG